MISAQKISKVKRFYVKIQIEKNHREERENSLVCRRYSEFVEISFVYNLFGLDWLGSPFFSSSSQRINILRVITDNVGRVKFHNHIIYTLCSLVTAQVTTLWLL